MRNTIVAVLGASLIAISTAQAATVSGRHHTQTKDHAVASEQFRNSNGYVAPDKIAVPSYWSEEAEGAMTSGIAGH